MAIKDKRKYRVAGKSDDYLDSYVKKRRNGMAGESLGRPTQAPDIGRTIPLRAGVPTAPKAQQNDTHADAYSATMNAFYNDELPRPAPAREQHRPEADPNATNIQVATPHSRDEMSPEMPSPFVGRGRLEVPKNKIDESRAYAEAERSPDGSGPAWERYQEARRNGELGSLQQPMQRVSLLSASPDARAERQRIMETGADIQAMEGSQGYAISNGTYAQQPEYKSKLDPALANYSPEGRGRILAKPTRGAGSMQDFLNPNQRGGGTERYVPNAQQTRDLPSQLPSTQKDIDSGFVKYADKDIDPGFTRYQDAIDKIKVAPRMTNEAREKATNSLTEDYQNRIAEVTKKSDAEKNAIAQAEQKRNDTIAIKNAEITAQAKAEEQAAINAEQRAAQTAEKNRPNEIADAEREQRYAMDKLFGKASVDARVAEINNSGKSDEAMSRRIKKDITAVKRANTKVDDRSKDVWTHVRDAITLQTMMSDPVQQKEMQETLLKDTGKRKEFISLYEQLLKKYPNDMPKVRQGIQMAIDREKEA